MCQIFLLGLTESTQEIRKCLMGCAPIQDCAPSRVFFFAGIFGAFHADLSFLRPVAHALSLFERMKATDCAMKKGMEKVHINGIMNVIHWIQF